MTRWSRWERWLQWVMTVGVVFGFLVWSCFGDTRHATLLRTSLRQDLVGCYKLTTPHGRPLAHPEYYNASPKVYLDSTPRWFTTSYGETIHTARRVMVVLDSAGQPTAVEFPGLGVGPSWSMDSVAEKLYLSFSDGFSGAYLTLSAPRGTGDTLRGLISDHWDFGPPFDDPHGGGMAVRVSCRGSGGRELTTVDSGSSDPDLRAILAAYAVKKVSPDSAASRLLDYVKARGVRFLNIAIDPPLRLALQMEEHRRERGLQ